MEVEDKVSTNLRYFFKTLQIEDVAVETIFDGIAIFNSEAIACKKGYCRERYAVYQRWQTLFQTLLILQKDQTQVPLSEHALTSLDSTEHVTISSVKRVGQIYKGEEEILSLILAGLLQELSSHKDHVCDHRPVFPEAVLCFKYN